MLRHICFVFDLSPLWVDIPLCRLEGGVAPAWTFRHAASSFTPMARRPGAFRPRKLRRCANKPRDRPGNLYPVTALAK
jgi:hypothetical protein